MTSDNNHLLSLPVPETCPLLQPEKNPSKTTHHPHSEDSYSAFYGVLWISLAALGFSFMTTAIRLSAAKFDFSPSAALLLRSIVHLTFSTISLIFIVHVSPLDLSPPQLGLLAIRGLLGTLAMALVYKSLVHVPAGEATAIFMFSPILTMLFSKLFLKESTSIWDVLCAIVGIIGIWLIAEPGTSDHQHIYGVILLVFAACFAAAAYVCVRGMGTQVHFMLSTFALGALGVPVAAALGGKEAFDQILSRHDGIGIVLLGSLAAFFAQSCLNKGLQSSKAGQAVVMKNLEVPSAYVLGILVLNERPTTIRFLGSLMVISAVIIIGFRRLRLR